MVRNQKRQHTTHICDTWQRHVVINAEFQTNKADFNHVTSEADISFYTLYYPHHFCPHYLRYYSTIRALSSNSNSLVGSLPIFIFLKIFLVHRFKIHFLRFVILIWNWNSFLTILISNRFFSHNSSSFEIQFLCDFLFQTQFEIHFCLFLVSNWSRISGRSGWHVTKVLQYHAF